MNHFIDILPALVNRRQQDASEFFICLMNYINSETCSRLGRNNYPKGENFPGSLI